LLYSIVIAAHSVLKMGSPRAYIVPTKERWPRNRGPCRRPWRLDIQHRTGAWLGIPLAVSKCADGNGRWASTTSCSGFVTTTVAKFNRFYGPMGMARCRSTRSRHGIPTWVRSRCSVWPL